MSAESKPKWRSLYTFSAKASHRSVAFWGFCLLSHALSPSEQQFREAEAQGVRVTSPMPGGYEMRL